MGASVFLFFAGFLIGICSVSNSNYFFFIKQKKTHKSNNNSLVLRLARTISRIISITHQNPLRIIFSFGKFSKFLGKLFCRKINKDFQRPSVSHHHHHQHLHLHLHHRLNHTHHIYLMRCPNVYRSIFILCFIWTSWGFILLLLLLFSCWIDKRGGAAFYKRAHKKSLKKLKNWKKRNENKRKKQKKSEDEQRKKNKKRKIIGNIPLRLPLN